MREAVYVASRNLYPDMATAAKSLIANSSVDRIWFVIEDDDYPHDVPRDIVQTINMRRQRIFPSSGPNFKTRYSYLCLLRAAYTKFLPKDVAKVLQLDIDTVVVDDVDELFDLDMGTSWCAMCNEELGTWKPYGPRYYNAGVALFNLEQIRKDGIDNTVINFLNSTEVPYIDQDAWSFLGNERTIDLPVRFNECGMVGYTEQPAIVHFAGYGNGWTDPDSTRCPRREHLRKYREMGWDEAMEMHARRQRAAADRAGRHGQE